MILDLSFTPRTTAHSFKAVNDASDKSLAPHHAMFELGNVIPRLIHTLASAPDTGIPFLFSKIDLKDGFWRMTVNETDAWNFAYVLPPLHPADEPQLVIPDSLQMGWSESPPFFCAATETARDLAQISLDKNQQLPKHHMEDIVMNIDWSQIPAHTAEPQLTKFLTLLEVYVDDFIAITQSTDEDHLRNVTRHLLDAIDSIFPGPATTKSNLGPAISKKKLLAEGVWETRKEILGWLIDGIHRTIALPQKKAKSLVDQLRQMRRSKATVRLKDFQKLHGRLQFTTVALPCGRALLGPLDKVISSTLKDHKTRIRINDYLRGLLSDWTALIHLTASRPTHARELVEHPPSFRGFVDASKWGVGGVWFGGSDQVEPLVWFFEWPSTIRDAMVGPTRNSGTLSISDLELAGIFMHFLALEAYTQHLNISLTHKSVAIWCDNLPAVAWTYKFRTATSKPAARLLRALAVRLHETHSALINIQHISGVYNKMADVASRKHPTDPTAFLTLFTTHFPPPQNAYWTLYRFPSNLLSRICSEIQHKPSPLASWRRLKKRAGAFGRLGSNGYTSISRLASPTSQPHHAHSEKRFWLPTPSMCDPAAFTTHGAKFVPKLSKWRSAPSARRSYWTENRLRWDRRKQATLRQSNNFWKATKERIRHHNQNSPSLSPSPGTSTPSEPAATTQNNVQLEKWSSSPSSSSSEWANTQPTQKATADAPTNSPSTT
jgi:hypothetical protein